MANQPTNEKAQKEQASNKPDEQQLKTVSAVGYLGILFLVPLLMFPKEKFAVFHANQGLLLLIAVIAAQIVVTILVPFTLGLGALLYPLVAIGALILLIVGVLNAVNGKMQRLPLIGNFDILKVQE
ncbi:MAG: hypothetical protein L0H36_02065 [bacterium]|nr:hypothetical protein [bacterium]MDN5835400.1 hypothetical protein [bacterium]